MGINLELAIWTIRGEVVGESNNLSRIATRGELFVDIQRREVERRGENRREQNRTEQKRIE